MNDGPTSGPHTGRRRTVNATTFRTIGRQLLRRANRYTLWAFNPQRELTSRYDRG
jgi:hypothetical protein